MFSKRKLLTVVCEGALESRLIKDLLTLGAKGYTVTDAHGTGPRNQRNGDLEKHSHRGCDRSGHTRKNH
jgi:hypothetical protein